jgi:hypothetical protein
MSMVILPIGWSRSLKVSSNDVLGRPRFQSKLMKDEWMPAQNPKKLSKMWGDQLLRTTHY